MKTAIPILMHRDHAVGDGWYHIMPMGEFATVAETSGGEKKRILEVVDDVALHRIMADYRAKSSDPNWPGYLVGFEHEPQDHEKRTEAAAWIRELQVRNTAQTAHGERGLWARMDKTPLGENVIGSVYKYFSTVNAMELIAANRYRPVDIDDVGLTNKPAYKTLLPAMHRERNAEEHKEMLDKLKAVLAKHKLVLADDAGEDAAMEMVDTTLAGVAAVTQRAEKAEHRVEELEGEQLERDADAFVAAHKDQIADASKARALFVRNREAAEEMIGAIKVPDAKRVLHRQEGKTPENNAVEEGAEKAAHRDTLIAARKAELKCSHRDAWDYVQKTHPELF